MKYLKCYQIFNESLEGEIDDIFIPLKDKGYTVDIFVDESPKGPSYKMNDSKSGTISIYKLDTFFQLSDIKEDLQFAINYLESHLGVKTIWVGVISCDSRGIATGPFVDYESLDLVTDENILNISLIIN